VLFSSRYPRKQYDATVVTEISIRQTDDYYQPPCLHFQNMNYPDFSKLHITFLLCIQLWLTNTNSALIFRNTHARSDINKKCLLCVGVNTVV
jgi:hypothetical protein